MFFMSFLGLYLFWRWQHNSFMDEQRKIQAYQNARIESLENSLYSITIQYE